MSEKVPVMRGLFFYSRKQYSAIRKKGPMPRWFCKLDNGEVKEYTEMIEDETFKQYGKHITYMLKEEYDDVKCLGWGYFHSWGDIT